MRSLIAAGTCALVVTVLAACGGSGSSQPATKTIRVGGYVFAAPYSWHVRRLDSQVQAAPSPTASELVAVSVFPLLRSYKPALFGPVSHELDTAAAQLAKRLGGYVRTRATTTVAGSRVRQYVLVAKHGKQLVNEQITFYLRGKTELQLLCQWDSSAKSEPDYCKTLTSSFRPA
jgi:hypothetical protein